MVKKLQERLKKCFKNEKGFTLIELIVVIAILGILAMLIMPNVLGFQDNAVEAVAKQQFKVLDSAYMAKRALGTDLKNIQNIDATAENATTLTAVLGTSVRGIRAKTVTPNGDRLSSAVITVKEKTYTCTAAADGTVSAVEVTTGTTPATTPATTPKS